MRNRKVTRRYHHLPEEENIKIDDSRLSRPRLGIAPHFALNSMKRYHKVMRADLALDFRDDIDEPGRVRRHIPRLRAVERRLPHQCYAVDFPDPAKREATVVTRVAEIGAYSDIPYDIARPPAGGPVIP